VILIKWNNTYFFWGCSLYCDGLYTGSGAGSGDRACRVLECTDGRVTARLVDDGYIVYEGGSMEIGLTKDYSGWISKKEFEDGVLYIYSNNVNGNGVFGYVVADGVYYLERGVATAISASTVAVVIGGRGLWSIPSPV